jgi:alkenylglycerophosphocholine hydrolase
MVTTMLALPLLALTLSVFDWIVRWKDWLPVGYFTNPAAILTLLVWSYLASGWQGSMLWFGLALAFSLLGDILLGLPRRIFLGGMAAFLAAQICYIVAFSTTAIPLQLPSLIFLVSVGLAAYFIGKNILFGLAQTPETLKLQVPVLVYGSTVSLMFLSALMTLLKPQWAGLPSILAALGGWLFFTSDSLLASNLFVRPIRHGVVYVHLTYQLAQILLLSGALLANH